jgi:hypothetical protein
VFEVSRVIIITVAVKARTVRLAISCELRDKFLISSWRLTHFSSALPHKLRISLPFKFHCIFLILVGNFIECSSKKWFAGNTTSTTPHTTPTTTTTTTTTTTSTSSSSHPSTVTACVTRKTPQSTQSTIHSFSCDFHSHHQSLRTFTQSFSHFFYH